MCRIATTTHLGNSVIASVAKVGTRVASGQPMSKWLVLLAVAAGCTGCFSRHGQLHPAWAGLALAAEVISDIHQTHLQEREVAAEEAQAAAEEEMAEQQAAPEPEIELPPPPPVGFFCARSTSAADISLCTRDRASCTAARDAATLGVTDLEVCRAAEAAWCFAGRCYANQASCERQRGPDSIGSCQETL